MKFQKATYDNCNKFTKMADKTAIDACARPEVF